MTNIRATNLSIASRSRRLAATLIDLLLVPSLTIILVMVLDVAEQADDFTDQWWILHVLIIAICSYLTLNGYTLWKSGQTLGKKILNIATVVNQPKADDNFEFLRVPFWKLITIRALFFPLLFFSIIPPLVWVPALDIIWIFGRQRRCLHDYFCGTVVVKVK